MRRIEFVPLCLTLFFAAAAFPSMRAGAAEKDGDEFGDGIEIPARIARAEVGEWASYRLSDGGKSTLTVVEKSEDARGRYLVIRNERFSPKGKRRRPSEERVYITEAIEGLTHRNPGDVVSTADVLVQGRRIKAVVISEMEKGKIVKQTYLSDKIPVYGLVQGLTPREKTKTVLKIIDYGFALEEDPDD